MDVIFCDNFGQYGCLYLGHAIKFVNAHETSNRSLTATINYSDIFCNIFKHIRVCDENIHKFVMQFIKIADNINVVYSLKSRKKIFKLFVDNLKLKRLLLLEKKIMCRL